MLMSVPVVLVGCVNVGQAAMAPSRATIAKLESGRQALDGLAAIGVPRDSEAFNAANRVTVRHVTCAPQHGGSANCSYQVDRCDNRAQGGTAPKWCDRTSTFVRVNQERTMFNVTADGWGFPL